MDRLRQHMRDHITDSPPKAKVVSFAPARSATATTPKRFVWCGKRRTCSGVRRIIRLKSKLKPRPLLIVQSPN